MQNNYNQQRRDKRISMYRLRLGILQMYHKPLFNLFLIPILAVAMVAWKGINLFITSLNPPQILTSIYRYLSIILIVLILLLLILCLIECIAILTARDLEADMQDIFHSCGLRNSSPILIDKFENSGVNTYIFFSGISLSIWQSKKEAICSKMNVHFVEEIRYYKNNGRTIIMHVAPGIEQTKRGVLNDEQF